MKKTTKTFLLAVLSIFLSFYWAKCSINSDIHDWYTLFSIFSGIFGMLLFAIAIDLLSKN